MSGRRTERFVGPGRKDAPATDTKRRSRSVARGAVFLAALSVEACFGEYQLVDDAPLPAVPDPGVEDTCAPCLAEKCKEPLDACMASDRCREIVACANDCGEDPACLLECRRTGIESPTYEDYFECAFGGFTQSKCLTKCNAGQNWKCVERYSYWQQSQITLEVTIVDLSHASASQSPLPPWSGFRVARCRDPQGDPPSSTGCEDFAPVNPYGGRTLDVWKWYPAIGIEGDLDERRRYYYYPGQIVGSEPRRTPLLVHLRHRLTRQLGNDCDPTANVVTFLQSDCAASPAVSRVSLLEVDSEVVLEAKYVTSEGKVVDEPGPFGYVCNVPPGEVILRGTAVDTGQELSRRNVYVVDGWWTDVIVYPKTIR